jgi:hypothetical protein
MSQAAMHRGIHDVVHHADTAVTDRNVNTICSDTASQPVAKRCRPPPLRLPHNCPPILMRFPCFRTTL